MNVESQIIVSIIKKIKMIKLTEYSRAAGCSCKIAPAQLSAIIGKKTNSIIDANLLVGNETSDDAAVYAINDTDCIISTTDFFTPIVDDAFDYGAIAAANAISDVYAMGGKPLTAIAILGWPTDKLDASIAALVLEGARSKCAEAQIQLSGGHSIDSLEPFFGLAVTGLVSKNNIKKNSSCKINQTIYITKPIGLGILSAASKRNLIDPKDHITMIKWMKELNNLGTKLATRDYITAITDVTGFGLAGHLIEMAKGSQCTIYLNYDAIPILENVISYLDKNIMPDATFRNWSSYSKHIKFDSDVNIASAFKILPDPQTNGGLLFTVDNDKIDEFNVFLNENNIETICKPIAHCVPLLADEIYLQVLK